MIGEEKRIMEEMKRQQEIDMMYEIMQKNAKKYTENASNGDGNQHNGRGSGSNNHNITFDFEGKII